jgi:S-adenosylmethionine:tRNA ribosyltransferase-isomerase
MPPVSEKLTGLPRNSFSGLDLMKRSYAHAVGERYRFYSSGDACLLSPARVSDG